MLNSIKFSIIIVSLNPGERLTDTVKSVLDQTYDNYEIIIKDGGSKDGYIDKVRELKNQHISIYVQNDLSIYDAMNQAVKYCSGDYYIFLNCGDLFENEKVLEEMEKAISLESKDIYYGDMKRADTKGIVHSPGAITDFVCYKNIPCHQTCFYKSTMFDERAYDTRYPVRADYEHFLYCIYDKKATSVYVPVIVCLYEGKGFSETKEHLKMAAKEHAVITKKYIGNKSILYRALMIITLQPVRKFMADSPVFSGFYRGIQGLIYGRR